MATAVAMVCGCASAQGAGQAPSDAVATPLHTSLSVATATPTPTPTPTAVLAVQVRPFKEPNDYAHRNYCVAGATEVLLSAWEPQLPDVETVARAGHLDPRSGETGAHAAVAVNALLAGVVRSRIGHDRYTGTHTTDLATVLAALRADLGDTDAVTVFGHAVPVMVQTMTRTMPGWHGWNATHMITIYAADLATGDPNVDTVTYTETPSTVAAYGGPPTQTITVHALWVAMRQFIDESPRDPVNLIA